MGKVSFYLNLGLHVTTSPFFFCLFPLYLRECYGRCVGGSSYY
jgi:hypothetical protein